MWRLRCVTFSSTSRLIPLFNLLGLSLSLKERASGHPSRFSQRGPTTIPAAHPLVRSIPSRSTSSARVHPFQPGPRRSLSPLVTPSSSSSHALPCSRSSKRPTPAHLSLSFSLPLSQSRTLRRDVRARARYRVARKDEELNKLLKAVTCRRRG